MYYKETPRNCRKQKEGERAPCRGSLDNPALSPATATITNKARRAAQTYNVPVHNCGVHNHHPHPHITPRRVRPVVPSAPPLPVCHLPPLNNNCPPSTPSHPSVTQTHHDSARTFTTPELPPSGETALTQRPRTHIETNPPESVSRRIIRALRPHRPQLCLF